MSLDPLPVLTVGTGISAALVGGIFFTFSNFVMGALRRAGPETGMKAMQQINVTVLNPLFFLLFFGTGVLGAGAAAIALLAGAGPSGAYILAGAGLYIVGCIAVTARFNVPLNKALARVAADSLAGTETWVDYRDRWTFWNHVRTVACIGSAGFVLYGAFQM